MLPFTSCTWLGLPLRWLFTHFWLEIWFFSLNLLWNNFLRGCNVHDNHVSRCFICLPEGGDYFGVITWLWHNGYYCFILGIWVNQLEGREWSVVAELWMNGRIIIMHELEIKIASQKTMLLFIGLISVLVGTGTIVMSFCLFVWLGYISSLRLVPSFARIIW